MPEKEFKIKWNNKYLSGNDNLEKVGIKDRDVIEIKLSLNGGFDFYQV